MAAPRDLILAILADIAPDADLAGLGPAADMRAALGLDSMDWLNFVAALHERAGVDVPELDYPRIATLAGCVAYLDARRPAGGVT